MFDTKFYKNRWRTLNFRRIWFFYFFLSWHQIIKIRCIHEATMWGSQNQATYSLKERTLWNRWGSNMRIPIHILFTVRVATATDKRPAKEILLLWQRNFPPSKIQSKLYGKTIIKNLNQRFDSEIYEPKYSLPVYWSIYTW